MKLLTSYFFAIRYMPSYFLPISTAVWDPKWFHNFKSSRHVFLDKRNVLNGLRCEPLVPGESCQGLCCGAPCDYFPTTCEFLKQYSSQLETINRNDFIQRLDRLKGAAADYLNKEKTILDSTLFGGDMQPVFMFHETPENPCSERQPFTKWASQFADIEEFDWRNYL